MLRVILVDDENNAIKTLQSYLNKYVEDTTIVGIANSKSEAIDVINNTTFDLLLLDINLGDGTGFEVLESVSNKSFNVIFTTAYDEYAIKAFKYSALDYLLKPLNPEEFIASVNKVKELDQHVQKEQVQIASDFVSTTNRNKIVVNSSSEIAFVEINEIVRLRSEKNYTDIHLSNGQKVTATKTMKHYEDFLPEKDFFRIHQKHIVNLNYIRKFLKEDGGYVLLLDDTKIEVSRRRKDELINRLI